MIPLLEIDNEGIERNWKNKEDQDYVKKTVSVNFLDNSEIPVYTCDDLFLNLDVYKGIKGRTPLKECFVYGYCDNDDALVKYLQPYIESPNEYYVAVSLMSKDYEKYYKNGSYINKDGIDTDEDYWIYTDEHPEMVGEEEYENAWLQFTIYQLVRKDA